MSIIECFKTHTHHEFIHYVCQLCGQSPVNHYETLFTDVASPETMRARSIVLSALKNHVEICSIREYIPPKVGVR
jgi:hypothetical protein